MDHAAKGTDDPRCEGTVADPCIEDRDCLSPWIPTPEEAPDDHQLNAVDANGKPL